MHRKEQLNDLLRLLRETKEEDLERGWRYLQQEYEAAGCPYGRTKRGLEMWVRRGRAMGVNDGMYE